MSLFSRSFTYIVRNRSTIPQPICRSYSIFNSFASRRGDSQAPVVAVLYQATPPPLINGARKPAKPGGYRDSGADIAFAIQSSSGQRTQPTIITPVASPSPDTDADWVFPDTEEGILQALDMGATHIWANTVLYASHPMQNSSAIARAVSNSATPIKVIGQPPILVENLDDKAYVLDLLRSAPHQRFTLPQTWFLRHAEGESVVNQVDSLAIKKSQYPIMAKPARGRGSHGVKLCHSLNDLVEHVQTLYADESPHVIVEEYLAGEEATVTVLPPRFTHGYSALPPVVRFSHSDGVAPYNGTVAVTANSRPIDRQQREDKAYAKVQRECNGVAKMLGVTAPIRIDVRRRKANAGSEPNPFVIFDVNMKPNMTGPGRPGRDDQASLTLMAAQALSWDYTRLIERMVESAVDLETWRTIKPSTG